MDQPAAPTAAIERLADLAVKSLLVADVGGAKPRFRLLDTTRAYAIEKLAESGEGGRIARRHAEYYLTLFARFASENPLEGGIDDLGEYRRDIDNLRAALDWAFSPAGDDDGRVIDDLPAVQLWMHPAR